MSNLRVTTDISGERNGGSETKIFKNRNIASYHQRSRVLFSWLRCARVGWVHTIGCTFTISCPTHRWTVVLLIFSWFRDSPSFVSFPRIVAQSGYVPWHVVISVLLWLQNTMFDWECHPHFGLSLFLLVLTLFAPRFGVFFSWRFVQFQLIFISGVIKSIFSRPHQNIGWPLKRGIKCVKIDQFAVRIDAIARISHK